MSRRDTIIISALVNAALLAVLFVTAITSKNNEKEQAKQSAAAILEETSIDAKDLFSSIEEKAATVASSELVPQEAQKEFVSLVEQKETEVSKPAENVLYKLPQIAAEEKPQTVIPKKILEKQLSSGDKVKIIVKKGDSLDKIAKANKTTISKITKLNNLQNSFLRIGQELLVPADKSQVNVAKKNVSVPIVKSYAEYYSVKVGDNPYTIAIKHNVKLKDLLKLNNLDEKKARKLKPGDKLRIR